MCRFEHSTPEKAGATGPGYGNAPPLRGAFPTRNLGSIVAIPPPWIVYVLHPGRQINSSLFGFSVFVRPFQHYSITQVKIFPSCLECNPCLECSIIFISHKILLPLDIPRIFYLTTCYSMLYVTSNIILSNSIMAKAMLY